MASSVPQALPGSWEQETLQKREESTKQKIQIKQKLGTAETKDRSEGRLTNQEARSFCIFFLSLVAVVGLPLPFISFLLFKMTPPAFLFFVLTREYYKSRGDFLRRRVCNR